jgi:hypothetical protein
MRAGAFCCVAACLLLTMSQTDASAESPARTAVTAAQVQVDVFRGLADIFSRGMDTLTDTLNRHGYAARVYSTNAWPSAARRIADNYTRGHKNIVVLIGHSLGADATIDIANQLDNANIPVELIVTFDGTKPHQVPKNVLHLVNFYQTNGIGKRITPGPRFHGELSNVDLTGERGITHLTIDKAGHLHAHVIDKIAAVVQKDLEKRMKAAARDKSKKSASKKSTSNKR